MTVFFSRSLPLPKAHRVGKTIYNRHCEPKAKQSAFNKIHFINETKFLNLTLFKFGLFSILSNTRNDNKVMLIDN